MQSRMSGRAAFSLVMGLFFLGVAALHAQETGSSPQADNTPAAPRQDGETAPAVLLPESENSEVSPTGDAFPGFRNRTVVLDITARVMEQNQLVIWDESHQRITIPGRPVGLKLVGTNVVVAVQFTPYLRRRGQNVLVAQGQIWVDVPNRGIHYQTAMQTIPLEFNEPIYFFPLGSAARTDGAWIEIMLTMKPYREGTAESGTPARLPEGRR